MKKIIGIIILSIGLMSTGVTANAAELTKNEKAQAEKFHSQFDKSTAKEIVQYDYSDEEFYYFHSISKPWIKFNINKDDLIWTGGIKTEIKYTMIFTSYSKEILLAMKEIK